MVGEVYETLYCGQVVVTEYRNRNSVTVVFLDTGYALETTKDRLRAKKPPRLRDPLAKTVFGVGFIGEGPHKAHCRGADTRPFSIWRAMLRRCYYRGSRHHQRSYEGCTVCPEWHNFQNFADWFEANYPRDGERYQLDKDARFPGNTEYSPSACQFLTQARNLAARRCAGRRGSCTGHPRGGPF